MKKILALFFSMLFSVSLFSCSGNQINETEIKEEAQKLIESSYLINEIFYGKGIPASGDANDGGYAEASNIYLKENNITDIESIKSMTNKVYSSSIADTIFRTKLSSVNDGDTIITYARYYQTYKSDSSGNNVPDKIMVLTDAEILCKDKTEYLYDTIKINSSKNGKVSFSIDVNVINSEGKSKKTSNNITLVYENNAWRLDTLTLIQYNSVK